MTSIQTTLEQHGIAF